MMLTDEKKIFVSMLSKKKESKSSITLLCTKTSIVFNSEVKSLSTETIYLSTNNDSCT